MLRDSGKPHGGSRRAGDTMPSQRIFVDCAPIFVVGNRPEGPAWRTFCWLMMPGALPRMLSRRRPAVGRCDRDRNRRCASEQVRGLLRPGLGLRYQDRRAKQQENFLIWFPPRPPLVPPFELSFTWLSIPLLFFTPLLRSPFPLRLSQSSRSRAGPHPLRTQCPSCKKGPRITWAWITPASR